MTVRVFDSEQSVKTNERFESEPFLTIIIAAITNGQKIMWE